MSVKQSVFPAAILALAMAGPASAADIFAPAEFVDTAFQSYFVELRGGGLYVPDADFTSGVATNGNRLSGDIETELGFSVGVEGGVVFQNGFRVSAELDYFSISPDTANIVFVPGTASTAVSLTGDIYGFTGFVDAGYEYQAFGTFRPYATVGLGFVHMELDNVRSPAGLFGSSSSDDTRFAAKFGIGAAFDVSQSFSLVADYNYILPFDEFDFGFNVPGIQTTPFSVDVDMHRFQIGLRYRF